MPTTIILRYFPVIGRAEPLRHALADAAAQFEDVRVPLSQWPQYKEDPLFSGPYRGLPTLSWGSAMVAETLPIASFLARRLGQYEGLDDAAIAQLEAVCSNCYIEVALRVGETIWADLIYPGADLASTYPRLLARILEKLEGVDAQIPASGWLGGKKPAMADFFAAEAAQGLRYMLGPSREEALRARLPRLSALAEHVKARPAVARAWESRPAQFTTRPDEAAVIERLRALDLSAVAL